MNSSNPFDHDSLMYKLMKYLYKIQQQMQMVPYVWILIDIVQFSTIITSLLGYVIKQHFKISSQDLFNNFLSIFFNYSKIYDWLVISGTCSAFIVIIALLIYIVIQFRKDIKQSPKKKLLSYCALTGTISIGLFEFFSQVMANNLINIVSKIFNKQLQMGVLLISFFLFNMLMMLFVSIFNSDRRIFRFSLVVVSLGLNMLPFTLTCVLLIMLSLYYQFLDKIVYKKLFYFLIIATCVWCSLEVNDIQDYQITSREIYLAMTGFGLVVFYLHYTYDFMQATRIEQNKYLVSLYKKRLRKQDKKQDYFLADQYFTKYFLKQRQDNKNKINRSQNDEYYLMSSVQDWHEMDFKQRVIQKIKTQRLNNDNMQQAQSQIYYFQLLLQLKINMVQLLSQVFQFMSEKRNQNIQVIYQINKLTTQIEKQFSKNNQLEENDLQLEEIIYLEQLYKHFYNHYVSIVNLLQSIFENLFTRNGEITQNTEEKLNIFTVEQNILEKTLEQINSITGPKLQAKLYQILSEIWSKYQKNNQLSPALENSQNFMKISHQQTKQKFNFAYVVISNKIIKYASIKFLSTYSYKESYILGQTMALIFPRKFGFFVLELLQKNADKKVFHSQIPIINQKGLFQIVNATFYLIPQFKGQITYIVQFKKISEFQTKNLFLFNSQTLCIQCFNKKIVKRFKFSIQKISSILESQAIQFSNLFMFNNEQKDFLTFTQKSAQGNNRMNKRMMQNQSHGQKFTKQSQKSSSMKALMKMDYLSNLKKSSNKNVTLQGQISFDISNITYKVIKVEDASANKQPQTSHFNDKTDEINLFKQMNRNPQSQFQSSTKDLKKKFQNQEFFCPISNPYLPRILQKLNTMTTKNRMNNVALIKIIFAFGLIIFFAGMVGFKISSGQFQVQVVSFQSQAQNLNKQYSYFMSGILHVYQLHHMDTFPDQFISYYQQSRNMTYDQAKQFYLDEKLYLYKQKSQIIKLFQDVYFQVPILQDSQLIPVIIDGGLFLLQGTSKTTLYYDIVVFLLDSQNEGLKKVIAGNFNIYVTMMKILRPDGRYNEKINKLDQQPAIILLSVGIIVTLMYGFIYYWLFQLRQARQDIILMYKYIEKKQIIQYKRKIQDVQALIDILSNNKKPPSDSTTSQKTKNSLFNTISELNSAGNIRSQLNMSQMDSVKTMEMQGNAEGQNQNEGLISPSDKQEQRPHRKSLRKRILSESKLSVCIQTFLKYPIYIGFLVLNCGILFYANYSASQNSNNYIQAFKYFEKIRTANFQFRYLYATSQSSAFYSSVIGIPYDDSLVENISQKYTHFDYEKPTQFTFQSQENLCSEQSIQNIIDPIFANYSCVDVDGQILTHSFAQAQQRFEKNLRQISKQSYKELITQPQIRQIYFNTMYEFFIFENYLNKLSEGNFSENLSIMGSDVQMMLFYVFIGSVVWVIVSFIFVFVVTFPKLENELATIISLIKMIPPQTLFSIKVASLFKKRSILQKLDRL